jgi:hypothetical protein
MRRKLHFRQIHAVVILDLLLASIQTKGKHSSCIFHPQSSASTSFKKIEQFNCIS